MLTVKRVATKINVSQFQRLLENIVPEVGLKVSSRIRPLVGSRCSSVTPSQEIGIKDGRADSRPAPPQKHPGSS